MRRLQPAGDAIPASLRPVAKSVNENDRGARESAGPASKTAISIAPSSDSERRRQRGFAAGFWSATCESPEVRTSLYIIVIALAAVVVFAVVAPYFAQRGGAPVASGGPAMLAGAPAASYSLKRLDGVNDALANYRGHVVLVNLWASWCEPCRSETPALEQLFEQERSRGLVVLGINQGEDSKTAAEFARAMGVKYPVLLDQDQQYGRAYSGLGLPTTIIVDKDGKIAWGHDGELDLKQMTAVVRPLVGA